LFEPFFTTRGEGSGLGLAIVRQVADAHGGWVDWEPRAEGGSRFILYLPLAPQEHAHG
jgi:signal transduction histidine kinase